MTANTKNKAARPKSKPEPKLEYRTNADGWTAGQWRAKGDTVQLTKAQAKYENVSLATEQPAKAAPAKGSAAKK